MENTQHLVWTSTVGLITKDLRIVPRLGGNRPPGQVAYLADKITQLSRSPVYIDSAMSAFGIEWKSTVDTAMSANDPSGRTSLAVSRSGHQFRRPGRIEILLSQ